MFSIFHSLAHLRDDYSSGMRYLIVNVGFLTRILIYTMTLRGISTGGVGLKANGLCEPRPHAPAWQTLLTHRHHREQYPDRLKHKDEGRFTQCSRSARSPNKAGSVTPASLFRNPQCKTTAPWQSQFFGLHCLPDPFALPE